MEVVGPDLENGINSYNHGSVGAGAGPGLIADHEGNMMVVVRWL